MALLAAYRAAHAPDETLEQYLTRAFQTAPCETLNPTPEGMKGFAQYYARYQKALKAQHAAGEMQ